MLPRLKIRNGIRKGILEEGKPLGIILDELDIDHQLAEHHLNFLEEKHPEIRKAAIENLLKHAEKIDPALKLACRGDAAEEIRHVFNEFKLARKEGKRLRLTIKWLSDKTDISKRWVSQYIRMLENHPDPIVREIMGVTKFAPRETSRIRGELFLICLDAMINRQRITRKELADLVVKQLGIKHPNYRQIYQEIERIIHSEKFYDYFVKDVKKTIREPGTVMKKKARISRKAVIKPALRNAVKKSRLGISDEDIISQWAVEIKHDSYESIGDYEPNKIILVSRIAEKFGSEVPIILERINALIKAGKIRL